jgi:hypothetical protein
MIKTEVISLTPQLAKQLLSKNQLNRPLSSMIVGKYTEAIRRGEWQLNGEPVIVFSDGNLGDGQHRCAAVVRSGIAIPTILLTGIDPAAFGTINTGKLRKAPDTLAIKGEVNTTKLSAAGRSYLREFLSGRAAEDITTTQIVNCIDNHPHIRYWTGRYVSTKNSRLFPSSIAGILAVASEKHGLEITELFFQKITNGTGLLERDPALILRERFINQNGSNRLSAPTARNFIVKALNAHLSGKTITFLRMAQDEKDPVILKAQDQ